MAEVIDLANSSSEGDTPSRSEPSSPVQEEMERVASSSVASSSSAVPVEALKFKSGQFVVHATEVPQVLADLGFVALVVEGLGRVASESYEEAHRIAMRSKSEAIFEKLKVENRKFVEDSNGQLEIDVGTGQRRQVPVPGSKLRPLQNVVQGTLGEVLPAMSVATGVALEVKQPVILVNVQREGEAPVQRQSLHVDLSEKQKGFVAIVPLEEGVTLLIAPGSGSAVRNFRRLGDSERLSDKALAYLFPETPVIRLELELGMMVLLSGDTVHAGDSGVDGKRSLRMHWYVMNSDVENSTYLVEQFGKEIAVKFRCD